MNKDSPPELVNWAYASEDDDLPRHNSRERDSSVSSAVDSNENKIPSLILPSGDNGISYRIRRPWQVVAILAAAWVHLATGIMIALTGIILPSLINPEPGEMQLSENQAYLFSSMIHFGSIFGCALAGPFLFWIGQRASLLVFIPIAMISWIIIGFSHHFWLLIGSRFVSGLLVGLGTLAVNNFVLEICHTKVKGHAFATVDFFRQLGYIFVYSVGTSGLSWRYVSLTCGLLSCAIPLVLFARLHDSPRWLNTKGKTEQAQRALQFYRGEATDIVEELAEIMAEDVGGTGQDVCVQIKSMFEGSILRVMALVLYISIAAQFTGGLVTVMYASTIFKSANTGISEYYSTIIMGIFRSLGILLFYVGSQKFRRRTIVIVPLLLAAICMVVLGTFFYLQHSGVDLSSLFLVPLASVVFFSTLICMGSVSLMIFRSELMPNRLRAIASSFVSVIHSISGFVSSQCFPYMIDRMGLHGTFWFYAFNNVILATVVCLFVPETKDKSLEEIDKIIQRGLAPKFSCSWISQLGKFRTYNCNKEDKC